MRIFTTNTQEMQTLTGDTQGQATVSMNTHSIPIRAAKV